MGKIEHLDEFNFLVGFRLVDVYGSEVVEKDENGKKICGGFATIMQFVNDRNVGVDIDIVNGEVNIGGVYAVTDEGIPVKKYSSTSEMFKTARKDAKEHESGRSAFDF